MLTTLRDLPRSAKVMSWEIDWDNFDWSDVAPGGPLDPNMRAVWPLKFVPSDEIAKRCQRKRAMEDYMQSFMRDYRRLLRERRR